MMYHVLRRVMWVLRRARYHAYLRTSDWWSIRTAVMIRDKFRCRYCGRPAWEVHHVSYAHIFHEREHLDDLLAVCRGCHSLARR
jgi:5-methylcytosine-specific restriction endonuclease McrA